MNIKTNIHLETLRVLSNAIESIYLAKPTVNKMEKVYRSIGFDLAEKILAKYKASKKKHGNLFESNKPISITIKFHEAWALIEILIELCKDCGGDYERNHLQSIINDLDEKTI